MKRYVIVNLVGAAKDKVTLFIETDDIFRVKKMVESAGFGDYKILNDWRMVTGKLVREEGA